MRSNAGCRAAPCDRVPDPSRLAGLEIARIDEEHYRRLLQADDDALRATGALREHGAVRIHCGALAPYRAADGTVWSADRCFRGGTPLRRESRVSADFARAIDRTEEDPTYLAERFSDNAPFAYRVPLPAGRYRVSLHFAEVWAPHAAPGHRVFDVLIAGRRVPASYCVFDAVGFAIPDVHAFEANVRDGQLESEFDLRLGAPKIAAIAIAPSGDWAVRGGRAAPAARRAAGASSAKPVHHRARASSSATTRTASSPTSRTRTSTRTQRPSTEGLQRAPRASLHVRSGLRGQ